MSVGVFFIIFQTNCFSSVRRPSRLTTFYYATCLIKLNPQNVIHHTINSGCYPNQISTYNFLKSSDQHNQSLPLPLLNHLVMAHQRVTESESRVRGTATAKNIQNVVRKLAISEVILKKLETKESGTNTTAK